MRLYLRTYLLALLLGWIAWLVGSGCATPAEKPARDQPPQIGETDTNQPIRTTEKPALDQPPQISKTDANQPIRSGELDELTRAFADRYVGLLYSACDALKKDNPDPVQRREAQVLMVDCSTNIYDIASNADAFTRMLDLVVVSTLVSQVWIDDDRVAEVFAGREEVLVRALHNGRVEAWTLAAQVLRPDQIDLLDYLLWDWRRRNPDMVRVSFVRFSNFAIGRGKSANAELLAASGFFANVGQTGQAIDEARLLAERMFYMLKREPTLLRWQVDTLKEDIFNALDVRMTQADATADHVRAVVSEANELVTSIEPVSKSFNEMFKTADTLFARYDSWSRWSVAQGSRSFDIREYLEGLKELSVAVEKMNDMLKSSNELLGSSEWDRRIQQVSQSTDERMKMAAQQSQIVVHDVFWCLNVATGILFAIFILCLVAVFLFIRRLKTVAAYAGNAGGKEKSK